MSLHSLSLGALRGLVADRRPPDQTIGDPDRPYLLRWYVIPRNRFLNVYLHRFLRSDDDRALHNHPWTWNFSWLLQSAYREILPEVADDPSGRTQTFLRREGSVRLRRGEAFHRIELLRSAGVPRREIPVWTLFITGKRVRSWGFACPQGFKDWKDFTGFRKQGHGNEVGPGCGDDE